MLKNNSHLTSQEIADEFGIHHTTVGDHIKSLAFETQNMEPCLDKLITGDKKWILYENIKRKNLTANQEHIISNNSKTKYPSPKRSRRGIDFHHDNARPHTAIVTQQKLNALGWEVLGHPPYTPDIAPSDYYLFRSLQNYLTEKNSSPLKVFLRKLLTILTPKKRTYKKYDFKCYLEDGNK
ncbi:histone-lysine N-methyltransferase SETMAR [Trichonephila clavipes]|nr:histone-lysine N-methyltransferase SETMAR [Trichonephila clavipes]